MGATWALAGALLLWCGAGGDAAKQAPRREAERALRAIWKNRWKIIPSKGSHCDSYTPTRRPGKPDKHFIKQVKSPFAKVGILEICGRRDLYTEGNIQSSELDEFIYHEALVHPAMAAFQHFRGAPARAVFAAGGGEMSVAREALKWPTLEKVLTVDIDKILVETVRDFIPSMNGNAFKDSRSEVHFGDAVAALEATPNGTYSVITKDLPDPYEMQAAMSFHTVGFLRMAKSKLEEGGYFVDSIGPCNLTRGDLYDEAEDDDDDDDDDSMDSKGFLNVYGILKSVFKHVDIMHIPMTSWFGKNHMYCIFLASDAGALAGNIPAENIEQILPSQGAGTPTSSFHDGLRYYSGKVHGWSFKKSDSVEAALRRAAANAASSQDNIAKYVSMETSKSSDEL